MEEAERRQRDPSRRQGSRRRVSLLRCSPDTVQEHEGKQRRASAETHVITLAMQRQTQTKDGAGGAGRTHRQRQPCGVV